VPNAFLPTTYPFTLQISTIVLTLVATPPEKGLQNLHRLSYRPGKLDGCQWTSLRNPRCAMYRQHVLSLQQVLHLLSLTISYISGPTRTAVNSSCL